MGIGPFSNDDWMPSNYCQDHAKLEQRIKELERRLAKLPKADQSFISGDKILVEVCGEAAGEKNTVAILKYPAEAKFNGVKVVVYRTKTWKKLDKTVLDPHFSDDSFSPIARFSPDEAGIKVAISTYAKDKSGETGRMIKALNKAKRK